MPVQRDLRRKRRRSAYAKTLDTHLYTQKRTFLSVTSFSVYYPSRYCCLLSSSSVILFPPYYTSSPLPSSSTLSSASFYAIMLRGIGWTEDLHKLPQQRALGSSEPGAAKDASHIRCIRPPCCDDCLH